MLRRRISPFQRPRRCGGLAIVEFVIVAPLCLMMLMATGEFGRAFMQYNKLEKAVRDGARYVAGKARFGSTGLVNISAQLSLETRNLVVYGNKAGTGATLLPNLTTDQVTVVDAGSESVRVTVSYPYTPIFAFIPGFIYGADVGTSGYVFQAAITMRAL
jgi:Flp pilus assembly protein TadG